MFIDNIGQKWHNTSRQYNIEKYRDGMLIDFQILNRNINYDLYHG